MCFYFVTVMLQHRPAQGITHGAGCIAYCCHLSVLLHLHAYTGTGLHVSAAVFVRCSFWVRWRSVGVFRGSLACFCLCVFVLGFRTRLYKQTG